MPSPAGEREKAALRRRLVRHDALALAGALGLLVVAILGLIWATVRFDLKAGGFGAVLFGAVVVAVGPFLLVDRRRKRLMRELQADDLALQKGFGVGRGWLVDLRILQGTAPSGEDRGMMWTEGDRLYFSGHRTSFGLVPDQAAGPLRAVTPIEGLRHEWILPLALGTPAGPVALSFHPIDTEMRKVDTLPYEVRNWQSCASVSEGQRPPLARGFGVPPRGRVFLGALGSTLYWILLLGLAAHGDWIGVIFLASVGAYYLKACFPLARWRAWRDLGRLPK